LMVIRGLPKKYIRYSQKAQLASSLQLPTPGDLH